MERLLPGCFGGHYEQQNQNTQFSIPDDPVVGIGVSIHAFSGRCYFVLGVVLRAVLHLSHSAADHRKDLSYPKAVLQVGSAVVFPVRGTGIFGLFHVFQHRHVNTDISHRKYRDHIISDPDRHRALYYLPRTDQLDRLDLYRLCFWRCSGTPAVEWSAFYKHWYLVDVPLRVRICRLQRP